MPWITDTARRAVSTDHLQDVVILAEAADHSIVPRLLVEAILQQAKARFKHRFVFLNLYHPSTNNMRNELHHGRSVQHKQGAT